MCKVQAGPHIFKLLKININMSFLDLISPSDIAYVIAVIENGIAVWHEEAGTKVCKEMTHRFFGFPLSLIMVW